MRYLTIKRGLRLFYSTGRGNTTLPRRYVSDVITTRSPESNYRLYQWPSQCGATHPGVMVTREPPPHCTRLYLLQQMKHVSRINRNSNKANLCAEYVDDRNRCMSPYQSADLVEQWCKFQNIQPGDFAGNFIKLMDVKQRKLSNLILQGAPNSG
ncbi:parvo_NS1 domain-containing protein [Caerostris darwini]|uniref:Parvo_NS1 domain-containing protein n=1 Tax=Caerostris darwini TaxID=1538125 RepID=A0AAV4NBQ9_9ARAC|nr:parvo_NS1 domain-containing protein [Caerostris darwini]